MCERTNLQAYFYIEEVLKKKKCYKMTRVFFSFIFQKTSKESATSLTQ